MTTTLSRTLRHGLLAGGAVLVLGGAAVGIANAQAQPTPTPNAAQQQRPNRGQAFLDALAKRLNIPTADLQAAITQARTEAGLPAAGGPGFGFPGGPGGPRGF